MNSYTQSAGWAIRKAQLRKSYHVLMREVLHKNAHRLEMTNAAVAAGVSTALAQASGCHRTTLYRWGKRREEIAENVSSSTWTGDSFPRS